MIRALVWKETREQGVIVAALAVFGASVLAAVGIFNPPSSMTLDQKLLLDPGFLALVALTVTAGVVVGGTLFAGEKEAGTFAYLTYLPVPRWRVWVGKVCGGAVLVLAVAAALFAAAAGVGIVGPTNWLAVWGLLFGALALAAFGWGAVGSGMVRNSLAASGLGALFAVLATSSLFPLGVIFTNELVRLSRQYTSQGANTPFGVTAGLLTLFAIVGVPFVISLWAFTAPDRSRKRQAVFGTPGGKRVARGSRFRPFAWTNRIGGGFRASLWLVNRQSRLAGIILAAVGLVCGLAMLIPGTPLLAVWPSGTLFLALLVGVLSWADEQGAGAGRFWVERRTPVSRLWMAKVLVGVAHTLLITVMIALPTVLKFWLSKTTDDDRGSRLFFEYDFPRWKFFFVWPVYGFVFGHLVGLLFRKTLVAVSVALMVGAVAAAAWLPSLLSGGLRHWQLWLPPVLVLVTARVLVWSMTADRIGSRRAIARLTFGGVAVAAALGGGIAYRVLEIPSVPERHDDGLFRAQIPRLDDNKAGLELRRAAVLFQEARDGGLTGRDLFREPTPAQFYYQDELARVFPKGVADRLDFVLEHGWRPDPFLEPWLDQMFANGWAEVVEAAAAMPVGVLEDPIDLRINTAMRHLYGLHGADALLLAQGLRKQATGDPAAFARAFETVLAVSRTTRNKSVLASALAGRRMERRAYQALTRWLERQPDGGDLLNDIGCAVALHDAWATDDVAEVRLADQVVLRNSFQAAGDVLKRTWRYSDTNDGEEARRVMDIEADLVGFSWAVPWERERHQRLVGLGNRQPYPAEWPTWADEIADYAFPPDARRRREFDEMARTPFFGVPGVSVIPLLSSWNTKGIHGSAELRTTADRRAAILTLALRRYERDRGRMPESLDALVPEYLPAIPRDPCDGVFFRYRLAADGDEMVVEERTLAPVQETNEPAVLPSVQEMAWAGTPLGFQSFGPGAGGPGGPALGPGGGIVSGMFGPEMFDPFASVLGGAWDVESASAVVEVNALVRQFVEKRDGVTALTGFAAVLDNYLPIYAVNPAPAVGPYRRRAPLKPGTAILWSVGLDKTNHGGVRPNVTPTDPILDWVYVVPAEPRK